MARKGILSDLLQDEQFLFGAGLLSAGSMGQNLGQAALPSMINAARTANLFQNQQRMKDLRNQISDMDMSGFSDIEKALIQADPFKSLNLLQRKKKERKIIKGADGFNYFADTGDRVLPGVVKKDENVSKIKRDQTKNLQNLFVNNQVVKDFNVATSQYGKLLEGAKRKTAAGDMSMIFTYMKILDPTSVVREGEQATAAQATNVPGRILNLYNRSVKGERLNEEQRKDFVKTGTQLYNTNIKQLDAFKGSFTPSLDQFGIDKNQIFLTSDLRPKQVKTKDGQVIDSSNAQIIDYDLNTQEIVYQLPNGTIFRLKR